MSRTFRGIVKKGDLIAYREVSVYFIGGSLAHPWSGFVNVLSKETAPPELLDRYRLILEDGREFTGFVVTKSLPVSSPPVSFTLAEVISLHLA